MQIGNREVVGSEFCHPELCWLLLFLLLLTVWLTVWGAGCAQAHRRVTREDLLAGVLLFRARDYLEQVAAVQQLPELLARHPRVRPYPTRHPSFSTHCPAILRLSCPRWHGGVQAAPCDTSPHAAEVMVRGW